MQFTSSIQDTHYSILLPFFARGGKQLVQGPLRGWADQTTCTPRRREGVCWSLKWCVAPCLICISLVDNVSLMVIEISQGTPYCMRWMYSMAIRVLTEVQWGKIARVTRKSSMSGEVSVVNCIMLCLVWM